MSKPGFECNVEKIFEKFCNLAQQDMTRTVKRALSKGAQMLQDETKANLQGVIKTRGNKHWYNGEIVTYNDKIDDGVRRTKVYENSSTGDLNVKVHVLGTRADGSGTYRLRFLEAGTRDRYQKRFKGKELQTPRRLGRIAGRRFFRAANQSVIPRLQNLYLQEISKSVERINKTKIK